MGNVGGKGEVCMCVQVGEQSYGMQCVVCYVEGKRKLRIRTCPCLPGHRPSH